MYYVVCYVFIFSVIHISLHCALPYFMFEAGSRLPRSSTGTVGVGLGY